MFWANPWEWLRAQPVWPVPPPETITVTRQEFNAARNLRGFDQGLAEAVTGPIGVWATNEIDAWRRRMERGQ